MTDDILSRYPELRGRPEAMALFCAALRSRGQHADAFAIGKAAIAAAPDSMAVRDEVRMALSRGVDRFHIPMLHDEVRNGFYARAIERAVKPGMKVLEVGTGAGLLALIAARAGAEVTTCEANPMVAAAAVEIIARNGLSDRIRVIPKVSSEVRVGEDLVQPADLLIHEIFGKQMVDEGVVGALGDARARLVKPGAPALPPRSCVRVALAGGAATSRRDDVGMVEGFDLSPFNLLARPFKRSLAARGSAMIPRSGPVSALGLDLEAPAPFGPRGETVTLVSHGGRIDGVVQWLQIDFGAGEIFHNSPFDDGPIFSSWGRPFVPLSTPVETQPGDLIDVTLRHRGTLLTIDAVAR